MIPEECSEGEDGNPGGRNRSVGAMGLRRQGHPCRAGKAGEGRPPP